MENEEWRDVVGYEDYFKISNQGRVWSKRSDKELRLYKNKKGYILLSSRIGGRTGKDICLRVHRLVAEAFLPEPDCYMKMWAESTFWKKVQVNHIDGNKENNNLSNLEWCTNKENQLHSLNDLGNMQNVLRGEETFISKLTEDDVRYILVNYRPRCKEYGSRALGRKFNVDHMQILRIVKRETWVHIEV